MLYHVVSNRYGRGVIANMNANINVTSFVEILHKTRIDNIFNGTFDSLEEYINHTCNQ